jgi:hypothetical protein
LIQALLHPEQAAAKQAARARMFADINAALEVEHNGVFERQQLIEHRKQARVLISFLKCSFMVPLTWYFLVSRKLSVVNWSVLPSVAPKPKPLMRYD